MLTSSAALDEDLEDRVALDPVVEADLAEDADDVRGRVGPDEWPLDGGSI